MLYPGERILPLAKSLPSCGPPGGSPGILWNSETTAASWVARWPTAIRKMAAESTHLGQERKCHSECTVSIVLRALGSLADSDSLSLVPIPFHICTNAHGYVVVPSQHGTNPTDAAEMPRGVENPAPPWLPARGEPHLGVCLEATLLASSICPSPWSPVQTVLMVSCPPTPNFRALPTQVPSEPFSATYKCPITSTCSSHHGQHCTSESLSQGGCVLCSGGWNAHCHLLPWVAKSRHTMFHQNSECSFSLRDGFLPCKANQLMPGSRLQHWPHQHSPQTVYTLQRSKSIQRMNTSTMKCPYPLISFLKVKVL